MLPAGQLALAYPLHVGAEFMRTCSRQFCLDSNPTISFNDKVTEFGLRCYSQHAEIHTVWLALLRWTLGSFLSFPSPLPSCSHGRE